VREAGDSLVLDPTTLANLEVCARCARAAGAARCCAVLDRTVTARGGRLLKDWLRRPLRDGARDRARLDAVERAGGVGGAPPAAARATSAAIGDLERLASRAVLGTLAPREAAALRDGAHAVPAIQSPLDGRAPSSSRELAGADPLPDLFADLELRCSGPRAAGLASRTAA
jgi:DNA mismatch repair protein MutS